MEFTSSNNVSSSSPSPTLQNTNSYYLWLPLIVVVVFTCVIILLIVIGRHAHQRFVKCLRHNDDGERNHNDLHLTTAIATSHTNDIVPETPPPSYSAIERQISYVSYISQTSSQLEIPPGYDEAIDFQFGLGDESLDRRTTRRQISQPGTSRDANSNQAAQASRPSGGTTRSRIFSRSASATDAPRNSHSHHTRQLSNRSDIQSTAIESVWEVDELEHTRSEQSIRLEHSMPDLIQQTQSAGSARTAAGTTTSRTEVSQPTSRHIQTDVVEQTPDETNHRSPALTSSVQPNVENVPPTNSSSVSAPSDTSPVHECFYIGDNEESEF